MARGIGPDHPKIALRSEPRGGTEKQIIRETDAEAIRLARTLLRTARYGALAVLDPQVGRAAGKPGRSRHRSRRHAADPGVVAVGAYRRTRRRPALLAAARRAGQRRSAGASAHQHTLPGRAAAARHAGAGARRAALSQSPSQGQALCRLRRFRLLPFGGRARQPQWRLRQGLSPGSHQISCSTVRQTTSSPMPSSRRSTT